MADNTINRYRRFQGWDYTKGASLFVTIATEPRRPLFGRVVDGKVELSELGRQVDEAILAIPRLNPGIRLFKRVVMPDHVHFSLCIEPGLAEPLKMLGKAIGRFKNYTTKQAKLLGLVGHSPTIAARTPIVTGSDTQAGSDGLAAPGRSTILWQQGYHDWLCPTREKIEATDRYIAYNPLKWQLMYGQPDYLRIKEPLSSPRLAIGDYWKGVGNLALLGDDAKLVALRVSREVASPEAIAMVVKRLEAAVDKGYAVVSGFISKGERAVRDMLCRRPDARFIRMLPSCIPNRRFKPESVYVAPFAEGRYLEIGRGNDEREFGRGACLDINAEIIEIATAGEGLALYWKADGAHVVARSDGKSNGGRCMKEVE